MKEIGVALLFLLLLSDGVANQAKTETNSAGNMVTLCDLTSDPSKYDGKTVNVSTVLGTGPEGGVAFDDSCKQKSYAFLSFNESNKSESRLDKRLSSIFKRGGEAKVTAVALFIDGKARMFGHQDCCRYKLEIQRLLTVNTAN
jgi:hypothetical protein